MKRHRHHNYLRSCRKKLGLTQNQLAFLLGLESGSRISVLEGGRGLPTLREAVMFERLFGQAVCAIWPEWVKKTEENFESHIEKLVNGLARSFLGSRRKQQRAAFTRRQLTVVLDGPSPIGE